MGELSLIAWMRSRVPERGDIIVGPGDDAAVIRMPDMADVDLLFCADAMAEGTHFLLEANDVVTRRDGNDSAFPPRITPEQAGWKLLAENISDIAAMGGTPGYCVATFHAPPGTPDTVGRGLFDGLLACANTFGVMHVGGDVIRTDGALNVSLSLIGTVPAGRAVTRAGAKPSDAIYVTGTLGGSLLGKHHAFTPRVVEGRFIASSGIVGAMIDISDGLALDLCRILDASGTLGARVQCDAIPVSDAAVELAARSGRAPIEHALSDGEDFELLFTVKGAEADRFESAWRRETNLAALTRIGTVSEKGRARVIVSTDGTERQLGHAGFVHDWAE